MACAQAWHAAPVPVSQGQSSGKRSTGSFPDPPHTGDGHGYRRHTCNGVHRRRDKGDSPVLPHMLDQIPTGEQIGTLTGDGAFDTSRCHTAILARGGAAIIPIRRNGRRWREDCSAARARNEILKATQRLGRIRRTCAAPLAPRFLLILETLVRISCPKPDRGEDDPAGSLEPVAFTCSTSRPSVSASHHATRTARQPKSRSALHS